MLTVWMARAHATRLSTESDAGIDKNVLSYQGTRDSSQCETPVIRGFREPCAESGTRECYHEEGG